jgi:hypothetical protein
MINIYLFVITLRKAKEGLIPWLDNPSMESETGSGKNLFKIPDPGVKKAPDPIRIRNTSCTCAMNFLKLMINIYLFVITLRKAKEDLIPWSDNPSMESELSMLRQYGPSVDEDIMRRCIKFVCFEG